MSIWFYMFLIVLAILLFFIIKIFIMKNEIKNIGDSFSNILKLDTNNLIINNTNDKSLIKLSNILNENLKNFVN